MPRRTSGIVLLVVILDFVFLLPGLWFRGTLAQSLIESAPERYFWHGLATCTCETGLAIAATLVTLRATSGKRIPFRWAGLVAGATVCSMLIQVAAGPLSQGRPLDVGITFLIPRCVWLLVYFVAMVAEMQRAKYVTFEEWRLQSRP